LFTVHASAYSLTRTLRLLREFRHGYRNAEQEFVLAAIRIGRLMLTR
jgi:hypothetical protein